MLTKWSTLTSPVTRYMDPMYSWYDAMRRRYHLWRVLAKNASLSLFIKRKYRTCQHWETLYKIADPNTHQKCQGQERQGKNENCHRLEENTETTKLSVGYWIGFWNRRSTWGRRSGERPTGAQFSYQYCTSVNILLLKSVLCCDNYHDFTLCR